MTIKTKKKSVGQKASSSATSATSAQASGSNEEEPPISPAASAVSTEPSRCSRGRGRGHEGRTQVARLDPRDDWFSTAPEADNWFAGESGAAAVTNASAFEESPVRETKRSRKKHKSSGTAPNAGSSPPGNSGTGFNSEDEMEREHSPPNKQSLLEQYQLEKQFEETLRAKRGMVIKRMGEDGACLFRAVADQVYGDQEMHDEVRINCVEFMAKNADHFKHYVTEDFGDYLKRKRQLHCHGNSVEIQAMSEIYNRPIEVYQYSLEPINIFQGSYTTSDEPIRLSYHGSTHYNSLVDPYKATVGVGLGLPGHVPGSAERNLMNDAMAQSENVALEEAMLEDKMRETDWERTQEALEDQVARESYEQWLSDQKEKSAGNSRQDCSLPGSERHASSFPLHVAESAVTVKSPRTSPTPQIGSSTRVPSPKLLQRPIDASPKGSPQPGCSSSLSPSFQPPHTQADYTSLSQNGAFNECASLYTHVTPHTFGAEQGSESLDVSAAAYAGLSEDAILAQVLAQSQMEYLASLRPDEPQPSTSRDPS